MVSDILKLTIINTLCTQCIQILMNVLTVMVAVIITVPTLEAVTTVHVAMDMIWSTLILALVNLARHQ